MPESSHRRVKRPSKAGVMSDITRWRNRKEMREGVLRGLKDSLEWHEKFKVQTRRARALLAKYHYIQQDQRCDNRALDETLHCKYILPYQHGMKSLEEFIASTDVVHQIIEYAICSTREYEAALTMNELLEGLQTRLYAQK